MARKLRIAASVFFGLLTVALVLLWVRSFWWIDTGSVLVHQRYLVFYGVKPGQITLWGLAAPAAASALDTWDGLSLPVESFNENNPRPPAFGRFSMSDGIATIPLWAPVIVSAALAAVVWLQPSKRYSLRTLLIATTLVAVVLGLAVWAGR